MRIFLKKNLIAKGSCKNEHSDYQRKYFSSVNQVRVWVSANHMLSATQPSFPGVRSRFSSVQL